MQLRANSIAAPNKIRDSTLRLLEVDGLEYRAGPIPFGGDTFLAANVASMNVR